MKKRSGTYSKQGELHVAELLLVAIAFVWICSAMTQLVMAQS